MALLWIEGFETYGGSSNVAVDGLDYRYPGATVGSNTRVQDGRFFGKCVSSQGVTGMILTTPLLGTMNTVVVGFAFRAGVLSNRRICSIYEESGATEGVNIRMTSAGALEIYRGNTSLNSIAAQFVIDTWYYIELKVVVSNSGSYEVRINEATVLQDATEDTQAGAASNASNVVLWGGDLGSGYTRFDDWYIADDGTGEVTDFLGNCKVEALFPNADTADKDFSRSTGSDNYALIDENPPNEDTDYVESATTGHKDLYDLGNPSQVGDYIGVQPVIVCRKTDTANFDLIPILKSGSTEQAYDTVTVNDSDWMVAQATPAEVNPDTTDPWTQSELNSLQLGYEVG